MSFHRGSNTSSPKNHAGQQALAAVLQNRSDLRKSSIKAVMVFANDSFGDEEALMMVRKPAVQSMKEKLWENFPSRSEDPFEIARHFNLVFRPLLGIRNPIEYDEEASDPIMAGDLSACLGAILYAFRKLRSMPQMRMLSAMKRFFKAVGVMSRLIRKRNETRRSMLLDVVKWWEDEEERFRQKLDSDMQSWLFKFHHVLSDVIEQRANLSIPPEVKFGVVQMLYFRQRNAQRSAQARATWLQALHKIVDPLEELKGGATRTNTGKYMEPTEGLVRLARRKFWDVCDKQPPASRFGKESVTYERLMEVREEIVRLKSIENRKRLLSEFHAAVESTRNRRRASYLAMEARREDEYKKRLADRRERQKSFESVQQQRQDIMSRNRKSRRASAAVSVSSTAFTSDDEAAGPQFSAVSPKGMDRRESIATPPTSAGAARFSSPRSSIVSFAPPAAELAPPTALPTGSASHAVGSLRRVSSLRGSGGSSIVFTSHVADLMESSATSDTVITGGASQLRSSSVASPAHSFSTTVGGGGSVLTRMPSLCRSGSFARLEKAELESQIERDPLAFLQKFGTKQYESVLAEKEREFREQLEQTTMDEDRRLVQQLVFRKRHALTPQLEPFFEAPHRPSSPLMDEFVGDESDEEDAVPSSVSGLSRSRAEDPALRVHVPTTSTVRVRQPLAHDTKATLELQPLEAGTAMRPMSPALADVISPWRRCDARPKIEWPLNAKVPLRRSRTDVRNMGRASTPLSQQCSATMRGRLPLRLGPTKSEARHTSRKSPPAPQSRSNRSPLRQKSPDRPPLPLLADVDLSGTRQDGVEALLHPEPLTASSAAALLTHQRRERLGQLISVTPQSHNEAPAALAPQQLPRRAASSQGILPDRSAPRKMKAASAIWPTDILVRASFLGTDRSQRAAFKSQLQDLLEATAVL